MEDNRIVIFDGVCNFCNGAVNFIINRDPQGLYKFTPMQSDYAKSLMDKYGIRNVGVDTFLLIKDGECFIWTEAALEIANELSGMWYLCKVFKVVPRVLRDSAYRAFARNRYTLFGKTNKCMVPTQAYRERFVGV